MAEIRDLPGQLDLVLFPGRPTTLTLTWPTSLAGKTFTCSVDYGDGTGAHAYTVNVVTTTMTIVLAVADYAAEKFNGTIQINETTSGTVPIIYGRVRVSREVTPSQTSATVNVSSSTVNVSMNVWPVLQSTFATVAARTAAIPTPAAGNYAYLTTPKIETFYNGTSWDGQVPTFATLAAVNAAIPTPDTGMLVRVSGLGESLIYWNGSRWCFVADPATFSTKAARDAAIPSPNAGDFAYLSTPKVATFYNGSTWDGQFPTFTDIATLTAAMPSPDNGSSAWVTSPARRLYSYNGTAWVLIAGSLPRVLCHRSAAQSVPNATTTVLTWDTEDFDTDTLHDTAVNPGRITIPSGLGGVWMFWWTVIAFANATGSRASWLEKNTTGAGARYSNVGAVVNSASGDTFMSTSTVMNLVAGDFVNVIGFQDSGGALNMNTSATVAAFGGLYIGPT